MCCLFDLSFHVLMLCAVFAQGLADMSEVNALSAIIYSDYDDLLH